MARRAPAVCAMARPDRRGPGEADDVRLGRGDQRRAGLLAEPVHHVQHAGREAPVPGQPCERPCAERRVLGGLEHRGVAAEQRGKHLPCHVGDRRVGGDDQACHAERLPDGKRALVGHGAGGRPPVEAAPLPRQKHSHLDRRVGLAPRVLGRLAGLRCHEPGHLVLPLAQRERDRTQQVATAHDGAFRPRRLRPARGGERGLHVWRPGPDHLGEQLSGGRRVLDEALARHRGDFLAVDEIGNQRRTAEIGHVGPGRGAATTR